MKSLISSFPTFMLMVPVLALSQERGIERVERSFTFDQGKVLKLRIDIDGGQVRVESSKEGLRGSVSLRYTAGEFERRIDFDPEESRLKVRLDCRDMNFGDGKKAEAIVSLPTEVAIDFFAKIKAGEIDFELGGLKIVDFTLHNWAGEVQVSFDEPNRAEMEVLEVDAKVGEVTLSKLGNAHFKEAEINGGIGELQVDFTGDKLRRSTARVDLDIGETTVVLPRDLGVKMAISKFLFLSQVSVPSGFYRSGRYYYSDNYEQAPEGLFLKITSGIGELRMKTE